MNSFRLQAVGHLARDPDLTVKGDSTYSKFCLIGTDYQGADAGSDEGTVTTSIWFVAFGALGEKIARSAHKGDQLIVDATVRADNWTDSQGCKHYDYAFVVQGFRFGAPASRTPAVSGGGGNSAANE